MAMLVRPFSSVYWDAVVQVGFNATGCVVCWHGA
jgi:hypothetical protein